MENFLVHFEYPGISDFTNDFVTLLANIITSSLNIVIVFTLLVVTVNYFIIKFVIKAIIKDSNLKTIRVCDKDSAFIDEYDTELTHDDALIHIEDNYGKEVLDNVEKLVDKAKDFENRLITTLKTLRKILHIVELDIVEPKEIKENVNAASKLMLHVDNELRIFKNIFKLLSNDDITYKDEFLEICDITDRCRAIEKRINTICMALIVDNSSCN